MTTEELKVKITVDTSELRASVNQAKKTLEGVADPAKGTTAATKETAASMEELRHSMEAVRNAQWADLILDNMDTIKTKLTGIKNQWKSAANGFKTAAEEIRGAFDWKNFEGADTLKEKIESSVETMKGAKDSIRFSLKHIGQSFVQMKNLAVNALNSTIAKVTLLVGTIAGAVALIRNGFNIAQQAHEMEAAARKIGMSAQAYQEWVYVLERVGVSSDKLSDFVKTLTEEQLAVREGSEDMIAAFGALGLSAEEVVNLTQDELFRETVSRLQNVTNATERTSLAYRLLGEDAAELSNVLRLSNEETRQLASNFNILGGAMSASLLEKTSQMSVALQDMRAAWQGLKNTLAELVLPVLITVVQWITKAIAVVNLFIRTLFGLDDTPATSTGLEGATSGIGAYTDSVNGATEAVQKLKRTTMGFDELNIVQNPNADSGGSSSSSSSPGLSIPGVGGGSGSGLLGGLSDSLESVRGFFEKWKGFIQDFGPIALVGIGTLGVILSLLSGNWVAAAFWAGVAGLGFMSGEMNGAWDRWRQKLEDANLGFLPVCMVGIGAIGAVIALCMGNIPAAVGLAAMAGIGLALGGGDDLKGFIGKYGESIRDVVVPSMIGIGATGAVLALMLGNIPAALGLAALAGIGIALSGSSSFSEFTDRYGSQLSSVFTVCTIAIGFLGCVLSLMTGNIPGAIAMGALAGVALYNFSTGRNFFTDAIKVIQDAWATLSTWFNGNVKPVFTKTWWDSKFDSVRASAADKMTGIKQVFNTRWVEIKNWFNTNVGPKFTKAYWLGKFETIRAALAEKLTNVKSAVNTRWNEIKAFFNTAIAPKFTTAYWLAKFETIRASLAQKLADTKSAIGTRWNEIKKWFNTNIAPKFTLKFWQSKFNTIKDGAKAAFNGVITVVESAINSIIKKLNTISWKIPSYIPKYGGKKFGFDLKTVKIPRLATGGIAVNSTLANIGESGAEAVLPLERNTQWMDILAEKIAAKGGTPTKIVLKVGERELGWATINSINGITKQTGGLQLQLV